MSKEDVDRFIEATLPAGNDPQISGSFLPPLVKEIKDGQVIWKRLDPQNHEILGCVLSCHLVIEYYMYFHLLVNSRSAYDWGAARLTFSQKLRLLSGLEFSPQYDFLPLVGRLNRIRNRFSHHLGARLSMKDLKPFVDFLEKHELIEGKNVKRPEDAKLILSTFTSLVCAFLGASIIGAMQSNRERKSDQQT